MKRRERVARSVKAGVLAVILFAVSVPFVTNATSDTQKKIEEAQQKKEELDDKLEQSNDQLDQLESNRDSLKGKLNTLNSDLTNISVKLEDLETQIADKETEIAETEAALIEAHQVEEWQLECMNKRIQLMYEHNNASYFEIIFSSNSFSELLNIPDYIQMVSEYDQNMMEEYIANSDYIASEEQRLNNEKIELDALKVQAEAEKNKVMGLISQTSSGITAYGDQISSAEEEVLAYEAEIKKQEEDLKYLKKKLAEEIALSQVAANSKWRDISEISFAEGDRYLLANLIYCEAGGEPYAGQVAVGAVVMNRVLSSVFPDTVVGVIYQSKQFSPVASGRLGLALAENRATASCYKAADEAMSGITNVGTCVYFRTPIDGLEGLNIGGHVFY